MEKREFSGIRGRLGKTQTQMAQLLGSSLRAIQSFEQGLRKVPVHVERQALFLLVTMRSHQSKIRSCWAIKKCSLMARRNCPAWEFQIGHLCWFINGTICNGQVQESWQKKMKMCRKCNVFQSMLPNLKK